MFKQIPVHQVYKDVLAEMNRNMDLVYRYPSHYTTTEECPSTTEVCICLPLKDIIVYYPHPHRMMVASRGMTETMSKSRIKIKPRIRRRKYRHLRHINTVRYDRTLAKRLYFDGRHINGKGVFSTSRMYVFLSALFTKQQMKELKAYATAVYGKTKVIRMGSGAVIARNIARLRLINVTSDKYANADQETLKIVQSVDTEHVEHIVAAQAVD